MARSLLHLAGLKGMDGLGELPGDGTLHVYVGSSCAGVFKSGNAATLSSAYFEIAGAENHRITLSQAITSPVHTRHSADEDAEAGGAGAGARRDAGDSGVQVGAGHRAGDGG